jgi:hypothetical protein
MPAWPAGGQETKVSLNHLKDLPLYATEQPYEIWLDQVPEGVRQTNVEFELYHDIPIRDARAVGLDSFNIDDQGFEFLCHEYPQHLSISGAEEVNETPEQRRAILEYIDIMASFLCETYGGTKAVCYDWRVRNQCSKNGGASLLIQTRFDDPGEVLSTRFRRSIFFPKPPTPER